MTVDAVAARASKQTIYRRWPAKADLVVAAFAGAVVDLPAPQDTGSLRDDLLALLDSLLNELAELGDIIAGLLAELHRNPELATAMHRGYINTTPSRPGRLHPRSRPRGAHQRRRPRPAVAACSRHALFRVLLADQPVDRQLARRLVDDIVIPLACGANPPR